MTMHLMSPMWTTTGKKKSKQKYKSADHAKKARELKASWDLLMKKYESNNENVQPSKTNPSSSVRRPGSDTRHIPSLDTGAGVAAKKDIPEYTGEAMIGIGQLHKSNAIPIFQAEDAVDISKMRRN